ncbi:MAG TPA: class I mannose-6-phosphate isomerase, partial [Tepidisphaeraceae bacterium]|nr:class I mannose-6-phosphate isomerase [Tepidisphaeraceae bacterium]
MWGGRELARVADKNLPHAKLIGESWELYDFPPGAVGPDARAAGDSAERWTSSIIADGPLAGENLHSVMLLQHEALLGGASAVETEHGPQFPLLIKFLDARQDLSVQVHPPERYTKEHPEAKLKNECWFVLDHSDGARNLIGAKPGTTRAMFEQSLREGSCENLLNAIEVKTGDTFYLPSGTVHAMGEGIVAAEVQTP